MYAKLIITACILQGVYLLPLTLENPCSPDELSTIKQNLLNELEVVIGASGDLNQRLEEAKAAKAQTSESSPVLEIISEVDAIVDSLVPGECADLAKLDTGIEKKLVDVQRDKCEAKWEKNLMSLNHKLATSKNSIEYLRQKASLDLEMCALKNAALGCPAVESACQKVVTKLATKINSGANKTESGIGKALDEYASCQDKCTEKALGLKIAAESKALECGVQESEDDSDKPSGPNSSESNHSNEGEESNDANQQSNPNTAESDDTKPPETSVQVSESQQTDEDVPATITDIETVPEESEINEINEVAEDTEQDGDVAQEDHQLKSGQ